MGASKLQESLHSAPQAAAPGLPNPGIATHTSPGRRRRASKPRNRYIQFLRPLPSLEILNFLGTFNNLGIFDIREIGGPPPQGLQTQESLHTALQASKSRNRYI